MNRQGEGINLPQNSNRICLCGGKITNKRCSRGELCPILSAFDKGYEMPTFEEQIKVIEIIDPANPQ